MKIVHHFCGNCDEYVPAVQNQCNHVLHFLLSLVTAGLWLFVWVFCAMTQTSHCQRCGTRTLGGKAGTEFHKGVFFVGLLIVLFLATMLAASKIHWNAQEGGAAIFILVVGGGLVGLVLRGNRKKP